jgi:hypothetical protein
MLLGPRTFQGEDRHVVVPCGCCSMHSKRNIVVLQEFGLFVCRFYKDCRLMYVVIDDRIPVKAKDGRVVFASCCDPNELWVPLIEKVGPVCCC